MKGYYNDRNKTEKLINQWMGSERNADYLGAATRFKLSRQRCKNLFISMSFQNKSLAWKEISAKEYQQDPSLICKSMTRNRRKQFTLELGLDILQLISKYGKICKFNGNFENTHITVSEM